jgi:hypothetical protein
MFEFGKLYLHWRANPLDDNLFKRTAYGLSDALRSLVDFIRKLKCDGMNGHVLFLLRKGRRILGVAVLLIFT